MTEQPVNLRWARASLRRRRGLLAVVFVVGINAGLGAIILRPPWFTSASLVLLTLERDPSGEQSTRDMDTQVRIVGSDSVIGAAGDAVAPDLTRRELERRLTITAPTTDVISIVAKDPTAPGAEELANAVAAALIDYQAQATSSLSSAQRDALESRRSDLQATLDTVRSEIRATNVRLDGQDPDTARAKTDASALAQLSAEQADLVLQIDAVRERIDGTAEGAGGATVIQSASPAERRGLEITFGLAGLGGGVLLLAIASLLVLMRVRRDARLYTRDEIAGALGTPVLASVRTDRPTDQAGWRNLLAGYRPDEVDDLALRQAFLAIGVALPGQQRRSTTGTRLTVISLAGDPGGLSIAPQLASHAAALGINTRLVVSGGHESTTALEALCSASATEQPRPGLWVDTRLRRSPADLTVIQVVMDRLDPAATDVRPTPRAVLATSPGDATAQELARVAVWAHGLGSRVLGSIVADPDVEDRTSGRRYPGLLTSSPTLASPGPSSRPPDEPRPIHVVT